jgi:hypothetical protein
MIWNGRGLKEKAKPAFWAQKIYFSERKLVKLVVMQVKVVLYSHAMSLTATF